MMNSKLEENRNGEKGILIDMRFWAKYLMYAIGCLLFVVASVVGTHFGEMTTQSISKLQDKDNMRILMGYKDLNPEGFITDIDYTKDESDAGGYDGDMVNGKMHGYGTYTLDGNKYVGEFKNDNFNGQGTYISSNGDKYVGEWKNDMMHGYGTLTYSDGVKYVGEFQDSNATGGWYYWADGRKKWAYTDSQGNWEFQAEANSDRHIYNNSSKKETAQGNGLKKSVGEEDIDRIITYINKKSNNLKPTEKKVVSLTMDVVLQKLGKPDNKEKWSVIERWYYDDSYVEFENGVFTRCYEPHGKG